MAEELRLALLGELQITRGGVPLSGFVSNKAQALLCYLAVTGRAHQRPALAGLLWGEMPEIRAGANLRMALSNLRKLVGPYLLTTRQTAAFDRERPYWLDVEALQSGAANDDYEQLSAAVELYRGDLLEGFYLHDAPAFEEWALGQRERLRILVLGALHSLAAHHTARGEYQASIDFATRTLALEPWREEAHQQKMLLLARTGQRSAALAQYETCRRFLAQELDVEPSPETAALYERVKASALLRPHNLPPEPTPFIGRDKELAAIRRRLANPGCRLLTVVGVGGVGKSRLAIQAARLVAGDQIHMFLHGVTFVPLAGVESADLLVSAIANALNFSFHGRGLPEKQLLNYLREKELLLLLDNYEHLLPETTLLVDILRQAPDVKLMATSRERLNLREEWLFDVEGMLCPANDTTALHPVGPSGPVPADDGEIERLRTFDALRLFEASARRVQWRFSIAEERQTVVQICRLLEGLPLAIELSAAWLKTLSCSQIVQGIERSLDFLATSLHNVPARHRSMRAVFEHSWYLLSETERGVLRGLSVFRGGFTREAACEVAGASLPVLASLVDKSLLRLSPSGRYELHELLRQYAADKLRRADKLAAAPQAHNAARDRHCVYYAAFMKRQEPDLGSARAVETLAAIKTEIENVRAAWRWAVAQARIKEINHSLEGLSRYYLLAGPFREGEMLIEMGVERIGPLVDKADGPGREVQIIQAKLRAEQARFLNRQGMYDRAITAAQAAIDLASLAIEPDQTVSLEAAGYLHWGQALFRQAKYEVAQTRLEKALDRTTQSRQALRDLDVYSTDGSPLRQRSEWSQKELAQVLLVEASSLRNLGSVFLMQSDYDKARGYYERALHVYREVGDRRGESATLNNLGIVSRSQGDYAGAKVSYEQALSIKCEIGDRWGEGVTLNGLGLVSADQGDYAEARTSLERALSVFRDMGDRQSVGHTFSDLGLVSLYLGDYARGRTCQEQALTILCEVGDRRGECTTLADMGLLFHHLDDDQAARECSQKALLIAKDLGVRSSQSYASTRLGHALLGLGHPVEAEAAYRNALVLRQELDQPNQAAEVRSGLARVFLDQGRPTQAQAQVEKILNYLESHTPVTGSGHGLDGTFEPFRVYLTCYCVLRARRDPRAQTVLHTAHCLLVERAAKISDEELRRSFLENVAAHREIMKEFTRLC